MARLFLAHTSPALPARNKQVADIEAAEKEKMREKCNRILSHNINCFINRQLIYNFPEEIFADAGVMAIGELALCVCVVRGKSIVKINGQCSRHISTPLPKPDPSPFLSFPFLPLPLVSLPPPPEHADFDGIENLALVLGGEIVSTFDDPENVKLGSCKLIEEIMIGEDRLIHFSGVALGEACTIVLRGASTHILDEADRSLHDALCVLQATVKDR
jgi:T-complex protein 1 subunit beta